ncbi:MAG: hypothetical protein RBR22_13070, partial [Desulfuromonas sp.]|nr:hypothetical protein [Desulfuromonas sp.]
YAVAQPENAKVAMAFSGDALSTLTAKALSILNQSRVRKPIRGHAPQRLDSLAYFLNNKYSNPVWLRDSQLCSSPLITSCVTRSSVPDMRVINKP